MRKIVHLFLALVVAFNMMSCGDSHESFDVLAIYPVLADYHVIYADQTEDSIQILSSQDWTASLTASWISMDAFDMIGKISSQKDGYWPLAVYFSENATGELRYGALQVNSNGKTAGHPFVQTYWLNIQQPEATYTDDNYTKVAFIETISKSDTQAPIAFTLYSNGTLSSDAAWATPDSTSFEAGYTETNVTCEENETGSLRTANLTLKSGTGISTVIKLIQTPD